MSWEDELKKLAGMPVNIVDHGWVHIDNAIPFIHSLLKQQWISVKEKLPEEYKSSMSEEVLTLAGKIMSVKIYDYEFKRWSGSPYVTVTHWMPLPEPPIVKEKK